MSMMIDTFMPELDTEKERIFERKAWVAMFQSAPSNQWLDEGHYSEFTVIELSNTDQHWS
jgi:hypothetical protein